MDTLPDADVAELEKFAEALSKPGMPVRVKYAPPHIIVYHKKTGLSVICDAQQSLKLSGYVTLEQLKAAIKSEAGL